MKNNEDLQIDVQEAIWWEQLLYETEINVSAKNGIITLSGCVDSYAKKLEAEEVAKNVSGVKAVVEEIEIRFNAMGKNDNEIASEVLNALKWNWKVPEDKIKITVEDGWVSLEGELHWQYQKEAALKSVKHLNGVKGIVNKLTVKSEKTQDQIEKGGIEKALLRNWSTYNKDINVDVSGNRVTLNGTVNSVYQKEEAERIAFNAPGVLSVNNELVID